MSDAFLLPIVLYEHMGLRPAVARLIHYLVNVLHQSV
jgi:hypothetical protein